MLKCHAAFLAILLTGSASLAPAAEVNLGTLTDVVVSDAGDQPGLNSLRTGDAYTDFVHARLFVDAGTDRTAFFGQLVLSDTAWEPVRIFGAYLQHQILEDRQHFVQAGKIPNPGGTWGPRTYADRNPVVGVPFAYYWQSGLPVDGVPADLDALVARADAESRYGALMYYDNCWNVGIALLGTHGPFSYAAAATRGAPGNPVAGRPENDDIATHLRLGYSPVADVEVTASWGRGAYLTRDAAPSLAPGQSINDYDQDIFAGSLKLARGYLEFNGEFFWNRYETPLRDDGLTSWSWYADLEWDFAVGWYAAVRYDTMRFGDVETSTGSQPWDTDLQRIEGGVGYHVNRDLLLKAIVQTTDLGDGFTGETTLPMLQAVVGF